MTKLVRVCPKCSKINVKRLKEKIGEENVHIGCVGACRKDRLYYLVKLNDVPFGVFDYTDIDDKEHIAEAGIYVIENYRKYTRIVSACEFLVAYRHGIKKIKMHVKKDNVKAVLYNLVKVKNKLLGEDDSYVYFESVYLPFDECMKLYSDIFEKYDCEVLD